MKTTSDSIRGVGFLLLATTIFSLQNMAHMGLVLFDHIMNDWRDVIRTKIDVPTAIFTGEYSDNLPSQRWMHAMIVGSELYVYTKEEQGDHFLPFKNPVKFTEDLALFLAI